MAQTRLRFWNVSKRFQLMGVVHSSRERNNHYDGDLRAQFALCLAPITARTALKISALLAISAGLAQSRATVQ